MAKSNFVFKLKKQNVLPGGTLGNVTFRKKPSYSIGEAIKDFASSKSYALAYKVAQRATEEIRNKPKEFGWHNVTGNLANSIGLSLLRFYRQKSRSGGDVVDFAPFLNNPPTRISLKKGETYDLDKYWLGDSAKNRPFRGILGNKGYYGQDRRKQYAKALERGHYSHGNNFFQMFAYISMPYSKFVLLKKNIDFLEMIKELITSKFNGISSTEAKSIRRNM